MRYLCACVCMLMRMYSMICTQYFYRNKIYYTCCSPQLRSPAHALWFVRHLCQLALCIKSSTFTSLQDVVQHYVAYSDMKPLVDKLNILYEDGKYIYYSGLAI